MKKRIFSLILVASLIVPCMFLFTACKEEKPKAVVYVTQANGLNKAIKEVKNGGTVVLNVDVELKEEISITKKVTLDLNEKTISNSQEIWEDVENPKNDRLGLICVRSGGELIVTGNGTMQALENDCYAIWLDSETSKLTIENGTFIGNVSAVYVRKGQVEIKDGTFSIQQLSRYDDCRYLLNCLDANYLNETAQIIVTGGVFKDFNPSGNESEGLNTNYLADGYKVSAITNASGTTYTVFFNSNVS